MHRAGMKVWRSVWLVTILWACTWVGLAANSTADPDGFTLIVLPDTQNYSQSYPHIFTSQTAWIAQNAEKLNIQLVLHAGDVVNRGAEYGQWLIAERAMSTLLSTGIPTVVAIGNHDYDDEIRQTRQANNFNRYFGLDWYNQQPGFAGTFEPGRTENTYTLLDIGSRGYLVMSLEFGPRKAVVDWANQVIAAHPDRSVIIVTHNYMYADHTRSDEDARWNPKTYAGTRGDAMDGEDLWHALVKKHPNMLLVQNGHVLESGLGQRIDVGEHGNLVHQILANYQMRPQGGEGYLRIMEFRPSDGTIHVKTYSPFLERYLTDRYNEFVLYYDPDHHPVETGRLNVRMVAGDTGRPFVKQLVTVTSSEGQMFGNVKTDDDGRFELELPVGEFFLSSSPTGYPPVQYRVEVKADQAVSVDLTMRPTTVWAGRGGTIQGALAQVQTDDIVMMNRYIALGIADTVQNAQMAEVSRGRPLDFAAAGMPDGIDWINLPVISRTEPSAWQIRTVRYDTVQVKESGPDRAVVVASGVYTENPAVKVVTTYTMEPSRHWVQADTEITNGTGVDLTLWVGDILDNDDGTQVSYVPGVGDIAGSTLRTYEPAANWIGQYGASAQGYAIFYEPAVDGLMAFGNNQWIGSKHRITIPAGESYLLARHLVVMPSQGQGHKMAPLAELYQRLTGHVLITSPSPGTQIDQDVPIRFSLRHDSVTEIRVELDGVLLYSGPQPPDDLVLRPSELPGGTYRLTVTAVDGQGKQYRDSVDLVVQHVAIVTPQSGQRLRGQVDVEWVPVIPVEHVSDVSLSLVSVVAGTEFEVSASHGEEAAFARHVVIDTSLVPDGAYDLVVQATTVHGATSTATQRVLVENWNTLEDAIEAPLVSSWLGVLDRLKAVDRSAGWQHVEDDGTDVFGDPHRIQRRSESDEYLTWQLPNLQRYAFTVYARTDKIHGAIDISVSVDGTTWTSVAPTIEVVGTSEAGWRKVIISGEVAEPEAEWIRFSVAGSEIPAGELQLGHVMLRSPIEG